MWCIEIKFGTEWHNPRRIDSLMTFIIVPLDVLEVGRFAHPGQLIKFA